MSTCSHLRLTNTLMWNIPYRCHVSVTLQWPVPQFACSGNDANCCTVPNAAHCDKLLNSNSEQTFSQFGHRKWNGIVGLATVVRCPPDELRGTAHSSRTSCIMHHPLPATPSYKKYGFFEKVKASWIVKVVQRSRKVCKSSYSPDKL